MGSIIIFGSVNVDLVSRVARIARPGETVLSACYDTYFGGKGANQAVAAAHAARAAGGFVAMAGAIGQDSFGDDCAANFAGLGVDVSALQRTTARTGVAFISVDDRAENAITVASGANLCLSAEAVPEALVLSASTAIVQMEVPLAETLAFARRLPDDATLVFNFAPADENADPLALTAVLDRTDIFVVNEHEAEVAGRLAGEADGLAGLSRQFGVQLVVTLGAAGVDLYSPDGAKRHFEAPKVAVVDTTGAGDLFTGTLAARVDEGMSLPEAIAAAAHAASIACTRPGAQVDVFSHA
ncbi:PfkB family carbohydrate kinase [Aureimonas altamirensis]|uniref:PfkB family carbohydrate kinase n=1 Tax=Aureimonas altamirensis TaxID=370622 RepID=UPI0020368D3E|nr:PfkB family carbohydrate kinase [Aureimonas altamirensis]MCM2502801.1 PfkB family carbohydrate kinase [Aureimonas altamirensis]